MRSSDGSSDVCSSDLAEVLRRRDCGRHDPIRGGTRARRSSCAGGPVPVQGTRRRAPGADSAQRSDRARWLRSFVPATQATDVGESASRTLLDRGGSRSEEHTSELQSLMRISYAVFCLTKKKNKHIQNEWRE